MTPRRSLKLPSSPRAARFLTASLLLLLPLLYFYPAMLGKVVLTGGDGWTYSLPMRVLLGQMIAHGTIPLWNPYIFAGMPLLASVQPGVLYPLNWLFALLPPGVAMNAVMILSFHLALSGAYLYARRISVGRVGALVTAVIFTFGGFLTAHIEDTNLIAAAVWLPWVLLAIENLYQRVLWRWVALGALFIMLHVFAGLPQMTLYLALVSGAYVLFSLIAREERERRWRFAVAVLVMVVCGALLSAIQFLPMFELQQQGERAQIGYDYFALYALPPHRLFALIFPYFFGGTARPPYKFQGWDYWWIGKWQCAYAGMLGLLFSFVAVLGPQRRRLVWFWVMVAVASLLLAFGAYLPFEINRLLYRVPVYNLFRGSYRNLYEFIFAVAVLAGLGANYLVSMEREQARRALTRSIAALSVIVIGATLAYRFFLRRLGAAYAPPAQAGSLADPEAFIPLIFFILSAATLWFYARRKTSLAGAVLVGVLLLDLASWGHFFYWRGDDFRIVEHLADPPTVKYIKAREHDLHTFRIVSQSRLPWGMLNYELLNQPNVSIARGLPTVNGYDPMRLSRLSALAGGVDIFGTVQDLNSFGPSDQGFNLLNVKYLFRELKSGFEIKHDGIDFNQIAINLPLKPGAHVAMTQNAAMATELAVVTNMGQATHIPNGALVVKIKLHTKDGRVIERELQAGRDTSEWAYDAPNTRPFAKHQRARVAESWDAGEFQGHSYLARLPFERAEITSIELDYARDDAALLLMQASLYDAQTGVSTQLDGLNLTPERWRKLERFGNVELYENLQRLPRAWFVPQLIVKPRAEVLPAIKQGSLPDGTRFDPAQMALLEQEDFGGREVALPPVGEVANARVAVTRYAAQRIELETHNPQAGFLVLSEIYYRGWDARIDGEKSPVYRADYALRGIAIPPGDHRIEFVFRAPTFRTGAVYSMLGALILLAGAVVSHRRWRLASVLARPAAEHRGEA